MNSNLPARSLPLLLVCMLVPLVLGQTIMTNPNRTATVTGLCAAFPNRSQIISGDVKAEVEQYNAVMKTSFSISSKDLLTGAMSSLSNPAGLLTTFPELPKQYGIFVGPFALGWLLIMFVAPCTCFCCCCPACCPSACCRKPMGEPYTKCELIWPALVLIACLGLILAAGALGLSKTKDIETTVGAIGCSVSIALDDIINGNQTSNGKYFIGIKTLRSKVVTIKSSLSSVDSGFTNVVNSITTAEGTATSAANAISQIPQGAAGNRVPSFTYATPLNLVVTTGTVTSKISADLGSSAPADSGTTLGIALAKLQAIKTGLTSIKTTANSVKSAISSNSFNSSLDSVSSTLKGIVNTIESGDKMYYSIYSQATTYMPTVTTAMTGIYAGLVGVASVGILATLFLLICKTYKCRYILYFTCFLFFLIGFISLLLTTVLSAVLPVFYFACDLTTSSLANASGFSSNLGSLLPAQYVNLVTQCLPGESGDLLQSTFLGSATASLTDLRATMSSINQFDDAELNRQIDAAYAGVTNLINDYYTGRVIDFTSSPDQALLETLSNPISYGCAAMTTLDDSWVPTTSTPNTIACKSAATGTPPTAANCNPVTGTAVCKGCLDMTAIYANRGQANFNSEIGTRYAGCASLISDLTYVGRNWYKFKQSNYAPVLGRLPAVQTAVNNHKTQITSVKSAFNSVISSFTSTVNSIVDPHYGLVAGFNCVIIGDDLNLVNNAICQHGFRLMFFFRLAFGMAGFGMLFAMCCISCTGTRHYKQMEASLMTINTDAKPRDETLGDLYEKKSPTKGKAIDGTFY